MRDACHFFNLSHNLLKSEMVQRKENEAFSTPGFSCMWGTKVIQTACKCGLSTRSSDSLPSLSLMTHIREKVELPQVSASLMLVHWKAVGLAMHCCWEWLRMECLETEVILGQSVPQYMLLSLEWYNFLSFAQCSEMLLKNPLPPFISF